MTERLRKMIFAFFVASLVVKVVAESVPPGSIFPDRVRLPSLDGEFCQIQSTDEVLNTT